MRTGAVMTYVPAGAIAHLQAPPQQVVFVPAQCVSVDGDPPAVAGLQEHNFGPAIGLVAIADLSSEPTGDSHPQSPLYGKKGRFLGKSQATTRRGEKIIEPEPPRIGPAELVAESVYFIFRTCCFPSSLRNKS
jgi:hypothetical protein